MHASRPVTTREATHGFTLVEILAVIAIVAILLGLLLPGIQGVRESARLNQCRNNAKQMALAAIQHEHALGFFPVASGGYGSTGDPDLGAGDTVVITPDYPKGSLQTGGWQYNILPYMEQLPLHQLGAGLSGNAKRQEANKRIATLISTFACPSRSDPKIPHPNPFGNASNTGWHGYVVRSDFSGCKGSRPGPQGMIVGPNDNISGKTAVSPRLDWHVADGLSNVFLCGHRYLNPLEYKPPPGSVPCNGEGWTVGNDWDNMGGTGADGPEWGHSGPDQSIAPARNFNPLQDSPSEPSCGRFLAGSPHTWGHPRGGRFGSPHAALPMAMADGSVHAIDYAIDVAIFQKLGNVADGGSFGEATP